MEFEEGTILIVDEKIIKMKKETLKLARKYNDVSEPSNKEDPSLLTPTPSQQISESPQSSVMDLSSDLIKSKNLIDQFESEHKKLKTTSKNVPHKVSSPNKKPSPKTKASKINKNSKNAQKSVVSSLNNNNVENSNPSSLPFTKIPSKLVGMGVPPQQFNNPNISPLKQRIFPSKNVPLQPTPIYSKLPLNPNSPSPLSNLPPSLHASPSNLANAPSPLKQPNFSAQKMFKNNSPLFSNNINSNLANFNPNNNNNTNNNNMPFGLFNQQNNNNINNDPPNKIPGSGNNFPSSSLFPSDLSVSSKLVQMNNSFPSNHNLNPNSPSSTTVPQISTLNNNTPISGSQFHSTTLPNSNVSSPVSSLSPSNKSPLNNNSPFQTSSVNDSHFFENNLTSSPPPSDSFNKNPVSDLNDLPLQEEKDFKSDPSYILLEDNRKKVLSEISEIENKRNDLSTPLASRNPIIKNRALQSDQLLLQELQSKKEQLESVQKQIQQFSK